VGRGNATLTNVKAVSSEGPLCLRIRYLLPRISVFKFVFVRNISPHFWVSLLWTNNFQSENFSVLPCILYKNMFLEMFTHNWSLFVTIIIYTKFVFIEPNIPLFIPRVVVAILYVYQDQYTVELYVVNKIQLSYIFDRQIALFKQMSFKGIYNIITSILHVQC
jgi:hypothetical protein